MQEAPSSGNSSVGPKSWKRRFFSAKWICIRIALTIVLLVVFRYSVLAWLLAGQNAVWKTITHSTDNNPGVIARLLQCREPGASMLIRLGEAGAFPSATDAHIVPALQKVAARHPGAEVRAKAIEGLSRFDDERTLELAPAWLQDPEPNIRLATARLFRELGLENHVVILREAAQREPESRVRQALEDAIREVAPAALPPSERTVTVAAIQFMSEFGNPEKNRSRLAGFVREAARKGARIVVLPELAIQGYMGFDALTGWQVEGMPMAPGVKGVPCEAVAEPVPGPSTKAFGSLAAELGIYLTVPVLEADPASGRYFNTLCLMDPKGELRLHYRKRNPWPHGENGWASRGDRGLQVTDTEYGHLGLLICYDINFEPENIRHAGAGILLYSIAWVNREKSPWFGVQLPRIARDNQLAIVGANWTIPLHRGWHGYGDTRIISPSGRILAKTGNELREEIVYADMPVR